MQIDIETIGKLQRLRDIHETLVDMDRGPEWDEFRQQTLAEQQGLLADATRQFMPLVTLLIDAGVLYVVDEDRSEAEQRMLQVTGEGASGMDDCGIYLQCDDAAYIPTPPDR